MLSTLTLSLRSLVNAILGKVPGKPDRLNTATRMAMDAEPASFADFTTKPKAQSGAKGFQRDQREAPEVDPIEELRRIADRPAGSHRLRPRQGRRATPWLNLKATSKGPREPSHAALMKELMEDWVCVFWPAAR